MQVLVAEENQVKEDMHVEDEEEQLLEVEDQKVKLRLMITFYSQIYGNITSATCMARA